MMTEQDLYGDPEPTSFVRVNEDRLRHLEAGNKTLDRIYAAAREAHLIGPHDGAEELLRAIRRIQADN